MHKKKSYSPYTPASGPFLYRAFFWNLQNTKKPKSFGKTLEHYAGTTSLKIWAPRYSQKPMKKPSNFIFALV